MMETVAWLSGLPKNPFDWVFTRADQICVLKIILRSAMFCSSNFF